MKKVLFLMAVAIAAFTSCQNEQSQLDFADVQGKAVVQGYVYIDKGYIQDGENYVVKSLPAEGCAVLVKVPYTKYDADAAAGDKFFEGVCDANGFYKIEVPVGQTAITGVSVYTRPIVDKYYDLVNGAIVEKDASYGEYSSASIVLERGKICTASDICIQKNAESPIMTRSQVVALNGTVQEICEVREYIQEDYGEGHYEAHADVRNVSTPVNLVMTITNSDYPSEKIVYNITTTSNGEYKLSANLYDVWDIEKTKVEIETKAYLSSLTHYYYYVEVLKNEDSDDEVVPYYGEQKVTGYYSNGYTSTNLSDGALLIGARLNTIVLPFVPDYNNNKIYGIGDEEIDVVEYTYYYKLYGSWNPFNWGY